MAKYLTYTFKNKYTFDVNIKLIDNQFVNYWADRLEMVTTTLPNISWYTCRINNNIYHGKDEEIVSYLKGLYNCFDFFNKLNLENVNDELLELTFLQNNIDYLEQRHLNSWHRWFTKLEFLYSRKTVKVPNVEFQDLYFTIQEINRYVHKLECRTYYKTPRRKLFTNPFQYCVQFTNANHNANFTEDENHNVWSLLKNDILSDSIYDFFTEEYNYTVWMNEDILGKDQVKAWLDHDDLSEDDITGNLVLTPNITFDPNRLFPRVLDNEEFKNESKLSEKCLNRPPLGNIINADLINWENFPGSIVTRIKLNNKTIWESHE